MEVTILYWANLSFFLNCAESKGVELGFDPATGEVFDTGLGDINKQDIKKAQEELNKYGITQDRDWETKKD